MRLHENEALFRDAIQATAQRMNIPEVFIEKDYWVTVALHRIFHSPAAVFAVFKGGTALSKCHRLIERFSEDIDIAVIRVEGDSNNKMSQKLSKLTEQVEASMPEIAVAGITNKRGMIRKTAHAYSKVAGLKGEYGQVREHVVVEASWLGNFEPHVDARVSCYIADMILETGQAALLDEYDLHSFSLRVLSKERTLCEKIMSMVRFSFSADPYTDLSNKIRHVYDLHRMLADEAVKSFFDTPAFDAMLTRVGTDDVTSYKNDNGWLRNHPAEAMIFAAPAVTWERVGPAYRTRFKDMVYGKLPAEEALMTTLHMIAERLQSVAWAVV